MFSLNTDDTNWSLAQANSSVTGDQLFHRARMGPVDGKQEHLVLTVNMLNCFKDFISFFIKTYLTRILPSIYVYESYKAMS